MEGDEGQYSILLNLFVTWDISFCIVQFDIALFNATSHYALSTLHYVMSLCYAKCICAIWSPIVHFNMTFWYAKSNCVITGYQILWHCVIQSYHCVEKNSLVLLAYCLAQFHVCFCIAACYYACSNYADSDYAQPNYATRGAVISTLRKPIRDNHFFLNVNYSRKKLAYSRKNLIIQERTSLFNTGKKLIRERS